MNKQHQQIKLLPLGKGLKAELKASNPQESPFSIYPLNAKAGIPSPDGGEIPAAPDVYCTAGDFPGEIDLQWDPVPGATTYLVEVSNERPMMWRPLATTRQSKYTAKKLVSGTLYWFRVYAINLHGKSAWSTPALKVAP